MFLIASIAAAGLVLGAQAARAAGSGNGSANGTVKVAAPGFATGAAPGAATGAATGAARKGAISVTIDDGRLTLSATGFALVPVLRKIGAVAGFKVTVRGDFDSTSSRYESMTRVPLARALRRLVGGTTMVIVYEPLRDDGAERIAEVRLYARRRRAPEARP